MSINSEKEFEEKAIWFKRMGKAAADRQSRPAFASVINDIITQLKPKTRQIQRIKVNLADILGEKAQGHYKIDHINYYTAKIIVDSPVWLYEIQNRKNEILEKFKITQGCKKIKNIKFELGQVNL